MKIVGIIGYAGSGKGTVADAFVKNGWKKESFADPLKDAVSVLFGWPRELLEGDTPESREFREKVNDHWATLLNRPGLTPRKILQEFGSEVIRDSFHDEFWVKCMESRIAFEQLSDNPQDIVIPDCRFANEADAIRMCGGVIIKIVNPYQVLNEVHKHVSEASHTAIQPNYIIYNVGSLAELEEKAHKLCEYIEMDLDCVKIGSDGPPIFERIDPASGLFVSVHNDEYVARPLKSKFAE